MTGGRTRVAFAAAVSVLAASTALCAVFRGYAWLLPVAGGIAVVVAVCELVRRLPVPAALGPLLAAGAMTCYLCAVFASDTAVLHFLPGGGAFSTLGDLARSGFDDARALAPPVPAHDGLALITVTGIAAVALVVDFLAVTLRRAAIAGLPLLAIFALATSIARHGVGWVPFAIGSAGYLWLLLADNRDRLSRWGRTMGTVRVGRQRFSWSDQDVSTSPLSVLGRRIGVTAIAVGAALPLVVPGLHGGLPKGGHGTGGGGGTVVTVNPLVTIRAQLTTSKAVPLMRVSSTDPSPGYLRLTALQEFNGETFSPQELIAPAKADVHNGLPTPSITGTTVDTHVAVAGLDVHWLPMPVQARDVAVNGDWRYDTASNTVFSARSSTRNLTYTVVSIHPDLSATTLRAAPPAGSELDSYRDLPVMPPAIRDLAERLAVKAKTPFDRAVAIQHFLASPPFSYDTSVTASANVNALEDFLFHTHRGFCQQYATAMAVLARIDGIPSRIAVGFTHGDRQPDGTWLVTSHDAHAWPELYFPGTGWIGFEPTPRGDGQAIKPEFTVPRNNGGEIDKAKQKNHNGGGNGAPKPPVDRNQRYQDRLDPPVGPTPPITEIPSGLSGRWILVWTVLGLLGVALVTPSVVRQLTRRRRWRAARNPADRAHAAWDELRAAAIDAGVWWRSGMTPRTSARLLRTDAAGLGPDEEAALDRLVEAEQRVRYAANPDAVAADGLRRDAEQIRSALAAGLTPWQRTLMRVWPRSAVDSLRRSGAMFADLLDAVDAAMARARNRIRARVVHSTG